ncbi:MULTISPECIES: NAD-dependent protein deacetylase [Dyella]|uniref:NAD-dependent protein deacetylase n=2 Tax=Dyella TaxID=231454 RepID=A0A4R0Z025_9GAMM|nr:MULTISPECIES: NAD-dependent protein deacetylase [Dyella]TBR39333.1 NAD-dependent protein deacetylase [Dyella terrae]TCI13079.1 NAD-dependent protein deacetylase [Dyella soli]
MSDARPPSDHPASADLERDAAQLADFIGRYPRLFVLTGAGVSTDSGIPDYRDLEGDWKRPQPVTYQAFMGELRTRQRYWARSMVGWPRFSQAQPNAAHRALARLEAAGHVSLLLTQNVDRLHQRAGSQHVVDLHGRLDVVRCMANEHRLPRTDFQRMLEERNPSWVALEAVEAPDGDADLEGHDFSTFDIPACPSCGGILKPDVVFFGEGVPRERVEAAMAGLDASDAVLVIGSSLMVFSGFRFVNAAAKAGKPIAAVNRGKTRADALIGLKIEEPVGALLDIVCPA